MKQHIETEKLKHLDLVMQSKLVGFEVDPEIILYDHWAKSEFNIGKLIERIEKATGFPIKIYPKDASVERALDNESHYIVKFNLSNFMSEKEREEDGFIGVYKDKELCDALWFALLRIVGFKKV